MLKHLKRVFVSFTPGDPKAASARELLQRVSSPSAKRSNGACVVEFKVEEGGAEGRAYVDLTFSDGDTRRVPTKELSVEDVGRLIEQKAGEMEMKAVMKEVGHDPWKAENRLPPSKKG
ncbi:hypothetical protein HYH03_002914 [Edaphochlamys debaryana]|uniref:Large ribosomal subunit protein mL53 n=1 Tax=Edaphochlamys debaryana TaxID=47281 RepID=A0A835YAY6_9CHLO|nr:hypothetical protein HYH03_002914 [Edaphochlamys debaryana]|eukprot:KAG2499338.1 hypothetical protein HYH03_002914 [Edaphochlamys debaryana]